MQNYLLMNVLKNLFVLNLLALLVFVSCDDDDDGDSNPAPGGISLQTDDLLGEWRITRFIEDNEDETDDLDDFTLEFMDNGVLEITRISDSESIEASWLLSSNGERLTINIDDDDARRLDPDEELEELDDEWIFVELSGNTLELLEEDDDNDRDELTLQKN